MIYIHLTDVLYTARANTGIPFHRILTDSSSWKPRHFVEKRSPKQASKSEHEGKDQLNPKTSKLRKQGLFLLFKVGIENCLR